MMQLNRSRKYSRRNIETAFLRCFSNHHTSGWYRTPSGLPAILILRYAVSQSLSCAVRSSRQCHRRLQDIIAKDLVAMPHRLSKSEEVCGPSVPCFFGFDSFNRYSNLFGRDRQSLSAVSILLHLSSSSSPLPSDLQGLLGIATLRIQKEHNDREMGRHLV